MNSKRIKTIASYIVRTDKVIDVGCDHGYLGILLKKENRCGDLLLTDVRTSALNNAIRNIKENDLDIKTLLTDGLDKIDLSNYNVVTISGMGTSTILKILACLKNNNDINKIIIQSNNNLDQLRKGMEKLNYYLVDETVVFENNIWYIIMKYKKGYKPLKHYQILFGLLKSDKKNYYNYLLHNYINILKMIPKQKINLIISLKYKIYILKRLLKECK